MKAKLKVDSKLSEALQAEDFSYTQLTDEDSELRDEMVELTSSYKEFFVNGNDFTTTSCELYDQAVEFVFMYDVSSSEIQSYLASNLITALTGSVGVAQWKDERDKQVSTGPMAHIQFSFSQSAEGEDTIYIGVDKNHIRVYLDSFDPVTINDSSLYLWLHDAADKKLLDGVPENSSEKVETPVTTESALDADAELNSTGLAEADVDTSSSVIEFQDIKGLEGRILTLIEAAFSDKEQRNAIKTIVRKEFRKEIGKLDRADS